jgi:type IV pilus assembly PilO-like protein
VKGKLNTRTLGLIVAAVMLVYGAAGYFLLVSPKKGEASRLGEEISSTTVELAAARAATEVKDDTQPIAVADIFKLATAMPSSADMPGILLELARIADETGIRFNSITPQTAMPAGEYQTIPIDVNFDGSFYALSDFLFRLRTLVSVRRGELHASGRLFSVENVDFSEGESGFPTLKAALKLTAYVYGTGTGVTALPPVDPNATPPAEGAEAPAASAEASAAGATG